MVRYERQILSVKDDGRVACEGRIVAVLDSPKAGRTTITALVELPEEDPPATFGAGSDEPVDEVPKKATFFCGAEKANGSGLCEREVENPDDTCWQH
ncbi:hypothetical protein [Halapricum desulfuricans]|uniref:hypothetical protein n=1 Tax=Halapricum desulfuricans TaxID=2841257 RepID=UPI001E33C997|nr:hypothetical protein [Halapricum desulfuricans]